MDKIDEEINQLIEECQKAKSEFPFGPEDHKWVESPSTEAPVIEHGYVRGEDPYGHSVVPGIISVVSSSSIRDGVFTIRPRRGGVGYMVGREMVGDFSDMMRILSQKYKVAVIDTVTESEDLLYTLKKRLPKKVKYQSYEEPQSGKAKGKNRLYLDSGKHNRYNGGKDGRYRHKGRI